MIRCLAGALVLLLLCAIAGAQDDDSARSRTFIWIGNPDGPFTEAQVAYIANNYAIYMDNKTHGKRDYEVRLADVKRIKAVNPGIKAFGYIGMSARFNYDLFGEPFNSAHYLYSVLDNQPIGFGGASGRAGTWVDLTNFGYRSWLLGVVRDWMQRAPYDGILYDNTNTRRLEIDGPNIGLINHDDLRVDCSGEASPPCVKANKLTISKLKQWNAYIGVVLSETRHIGGAREVMYNGIGDSIEDRNDPPQLTLLDYADYAVNEKFCIQTLRGKEGDRIFLAADQYADDIDVMITLLARGHKLLQKTKYLRGTDITTPQQFEDYFGISKSRAMRFCYALFMMGHKPGMSFYKFGPGYSTEFTELTENPAELHVRLGWPTSRYDRTASVWRRTFERGVVYVNPTNESQSVVVDRTIQSYNNNTVGRVIDAGSTIGLKPRYALFGVYVPAPQRTTLEQITHAIFGTHVDVE